jgi:hypothetical protein
MSDSLSKGGLESPPSSNTGVEITRDGFASVWTCDWLSFTLRTSIDDGLAWAEDVLGGLTLLDRGAMGYSCGAAACGSGRVLWHPERSDMGIHVDLPSSSLGRLPVSLDVLIQGICNLGGSITRLDACKDRLGSLESADLAITEKRGVISHFRKAPYMGDRWHPGRTLYLGSVSSDSRVRLYDKGAERGGAADEWVRCEVQWRAERAHSVALAWFGGQDIGGFVRGVVDFREADADDSNRSRWPVCDWWLRWVGSGGILRLPPERRIASVERLLRWLDRAVAPSLAMALRHAGGDIEYIWKLIADGDERLKPWQVALVA